MQTLLPFGMNVDAQALCTSFADYVDCIVLSAAGTATLNPPVNGAKCALITPTADIYIKRNGAAAAPTSTVTAGTGTGGSVIYVPAGVGRLFGIDPNLTSIGFYSTPGATITIEWFSFTS